MLKLSEDLAFRGLVHQVSDEALWPLLDAGATTAYLGIDPTSDSLHVGNLVGVVALSGCRKPATARFSSQGVVPA